MAFFYNFIELTQYFNGNSGRRAKNFQPLNTTCKKNLNEIRSRFNLFQERNYSGGDEVSRVSARRSPFRAGSKGCISLGNHRPQVANPPTQFRCLRPIARTLATVTIYPGIPPCNFSQIRDPIAIEQSSVWKIPLLATIGLPGSHSFRLLQIPLTVPRF